MLDILALISLIVGIVLMTIGFKLHRVQCRLSKMSKLPTCAKGMVEEEHEIARMRKLQIWIASSD